MEAKEQADGEEAQDQTRTLCLLWQVRSGINRRSRYSPKSLCKPLRQGAQGYPIAYACRTCNGDKKSLDDSYLRDLLVLDSRSAQHPLAQRLFQEKFRPAVRRGQSGLAHDAKRLPATAVVTSTGGLIEVRLPQARVERVLSTIARGLSAVYLNQPLAPDTRLSAKPLYDWQEAQKEQELRLHPSLRMQKVSIADGHVFRCLYAYHPAHPIISCWYLIFFDQVIFFVATEAWLHYWRTGGILLESRGDAHPTEQAGTE
jgi:hypothetical protein